MRHLGFVLALTAGACWSSWSVSADDRVDFNRDVRPILSDACYQCHGPDAGRRKANLRLDTRDGLFDPGENGAPIVAGDLEASELIARVRSDDDAERMPPSGSGKRLTAEQVEIIERWVREGAEWQGHWAYQPVRRPEPPQAVLGLDQRNPIDRWVAAGLRRHGLQPAPQVDRPTLLRRLYLDFTGLPPTPAELAAFVADDRPTAFDRVVDRLLASPRHAERMAQQWLDLVRYADTTGYHGDNHQDVWLYRDWVIRACAENLPFDRFTTEQLAGDLIPGASVDQRIASGYNRILMTTQEGGAQAKEYEAKYAADRVRNASTVWLGATLGCAQCHDHKYDPFTTEDFYRFSAFFADLKETAVGVQEPTRIPSPGQASQVSRLDELTRAVERSVAAAAPALRAGQERWEEERRENESAWQPLRIVGLKSAAGAELQVQADASILASGASATTDRYILLATTDVPGITGLRIEAMPDPTLPAQGPGRADNGNAVLSEMQLSIDGEPVPLVEASQNHSQRGFPASSAIDSKPATGWALAPRNGRPSQAVFRLAHPAGARAPALIQLVLIMEHGHKHALGRFRISVTGQAEPLQRLNPLLPDPINEALALAADQRTAEQTESLRAYYKSIAPELAPARGALAQLQIQRNQVDAAMPTTLVSEVAMQPRVVRILPRGNWLDESGEPVAAATPAFLGDGQAAGHSTRLDLARWLTSDQNPLVSRVYVNRIWKQAFGRGLVATPDDFGSQGAWPTHPELLDWLAHEFQASGWDTRWLIRSIVRSRTYGQSSLPSEAARDTDPENHWLSRQNRFRLDAEQVRDQALLASGLLSQIVGGPSSRPYQPAGYWSYLNFPVREYQADHGSGLYRRGMYTYWCRTFLHPSLLAFDAPTREECTVDRPRSNTPMQALVLLNDPSYVEAARCLASRVLREAGERLDARIEYAYQLVLSRSPRSEELGPMLRLHESHLDYYREHPDEAQALLSTGEAAPDDPSPAAERAALTSLMRVLLNLHETITRY